MALLLLGSITIAGYQEVQRRAAIGAREAAFHGAWIGARADRAELLRRGAWSRLDDPALIDAVGRAAYVRQDDLALAASTKRSPGMAHTAATAMVAPLHMIGGFIGGSFDLSQDGFLEGAIDVELPPRAHLPAPFSSITLQLHQPFAVLADAWNSSGVAQVRSRTAGLVPTSALADLQKLWRPLLAPLSLLEPSLSRLCFGIIEPDRVPEDRLGPGRSSLPGRCP